MRSRENGFTLVELMVVMAIVAILLSIVTPRYFHHVDKAEEAVLRENLALMRDAIDKYHADSGRYPDTIEDLVAKRYLRKKPFDPVSDSDSNWIVIPPEDARLGGVYDVKSGSPGRARDGTLYRDW